MTGYEAGEFDAARQLQYSDCTVDRNSPAQPFAREGQPFACTYPILVVAVLIGLRVNVQIAPSYPVGDICRGGSCALIGDPAHVSAQGHVAATTRKLLLPDRLSGTITPRPVNIIGHRRAHLTVSGCPINTSYPARSILMSDLLSDYAEFHKRYEAESDRAVAIGGFGPSWAKTQPAFGSSPRDRMTCLKGTMPRWPRAS